MKNSRLLGLLIALFVFSGCNRYFVLSTASEPEIRYRSKQRVIGVEKVVVPKYLYKREIAIAKSSSEVTFMGSSVWAEDLDDGLTQRVIAFLQKKFNQPQVYGYPWGVDRDPALKIKVQITRFIAYGSKVYLDANYRIVDMKNNTEKAKLFNTSVATSKDSQSIVDAMHKAFTQLEEAIAKDINQIN